VLVSVEAGKNQDVVAALRQVAGVTQTHACWGQPDIFAYVKVDDDNAMANTVLLTIHATPGVRTTETHLVAPVLSPPDTRPARSTVEWLRAAPQHTSAANPNGSRPPAPSTRTTTSSPVRSARGRWRYAPAGGTGDRFDPAGSAGNTVSSRL
jgi:hypothetical protein